MNAEVRYSDEELREFKILIEEKIETARKKLRETLNSLSTTNNNISQHKIRNLEDSSMVEEQENLNFLVIRFKKLIQHLSFALARIEDKTYGICRKTGKLISKERLLLVPHATLSAEAKNTRRTLNE